MKSENGRSMLEMLSVLAIVGILSIGGISAFSKAMMKHKYIEYTQTINLFIRDILFYKKDWQKLPTGNQTAQLSKMPFIPPKWKINNNKITDNFGAAHRLVVSGKHLTYEYIIVTANTQKSEENMYRCQTFITDILKPMSSEIYYFNLWSGNTPLTEAWFGDSYCKQQLHCLSDMRIDQINNFCRSAIGNEANNSYLAIFF